MMDLTDLQACLRIPAANLEAINSVLTDSNSRIVRELIEVVVRYGSPDEINRRAQAARRPDALRQRIAETHPDYLADLQWLIDRRDSGAFISAADYRRRWGACHDDPGSPDDDFAVTLEISSLSYFPWLMEIARRAVERGDLMPGRFIRVRIMKEQEADGDLAACALAMQIMGCSYVEQPDTRGTDGSNIHLGGADTLVGYYGGVGQPNEHALRWVDEILYYYTRFGVKQVLDLNNGTVLIGFLLFRMGIDIEFKISVTLGHDNPYSALWTLLAARLFAREDGTTPLAGLNWSNSTSPETIEQAAGVRRALGLERLVRFEHHVTETWRGVVIQPYDRRNDLVRLARTVPNLSAKHEGGDPDVERLRRRPSDMFDYYRAKADIVAAGDWDDLTLSFMDRFEAMNHTARTLVENGLFFRAAPRLHHDLRTPRDR